MSTANTPLPPDFSTILLDNAPLGILIVQHDGIITWSNDTISIWLGIPHADLANTTFGDLRATHLRPHENLGDIYAVISDSETPTRWLQLTTTSVDFANNSYNALYFSDASEGISINNRLEQLQVIEPVSGLLNRRAMMQSLEPLVSRSRRYENPLSVIAIDLLNLDTLRTEHSPESADMAVLGLSHLLKDQLRWADIISRIDDNNIYIILPETNLADTIRLAEKISSQVAELQVDIEDASIPGLQACYGVSTWEKGNDSMLFLRNVKQALEIAMEKGPGTIETCKALA